MTSRKQIDSLFIHQFYRSISQMFLIPFKVFFFFKRLFFLLKQKKHLKRHGIRFIERSINNKRFSVIYIRPTCHSAFNGNVVIFENTVTLISERPLKQRLVTVRLRVIYLMAWAMFLSLLKLSRICLKISRRSLKTSV
jgi:hypothetical protein